MMTAKPRDFDALRPPRPGGTVPLFDFSWPNAELCDNPRHAEDCECLTLMAK